MRFSFLIFSAALWVSTVGRAESHSRGITNNGTQAQQQNLNGLGGFGGSGGMGYGVAGGGSGGGGGGGGGEEKRNGSKQAGEEARKGIEKSGTDFSSGIKQVSEGFTQAVKSLPQDDINKYLESLKSDDKDKEESEDDESGKSTTDMLVDGIVKDIQASNDLKISEMQQSAQTLITATQSATPATSLPNVSESLQSFQSTRRSNPIGEAFSAEPLNTNSSGAGAGGDHPGGESRGFANGSRVYNPPKQLPTIQ
jgi:hypothetical protein